MPVFGLGEHRLSPQSYVGVSQNELSEAVLRGRRPLGRAVGRIYQILRTTTYVLFSHLSDGLGALYFPQTSGPNCLARQWEIWFMTRILVVDDHPLVRRGIVQVLSAEFSAGAIGEASNAAEALSAIWGQEWQAVVLDISLPGRSGLELLKEIKTASPKLPVLILSTYPEAQFATRMLRAGAAGYLNKESSPEVLIQAIRRVLAGGKYISPAVAEHLASELGIDTSKPVHELLSDREYEVMLRIAAGQAVGQVAEELHLSVKTVSTYRTRILEKTGFKNNSEIAQYAIRNDLIK
jgi:two-component system invasion response regulator UvrY